MPDGGGPELNWRSVAVQAAFALGGALIIAFVFVPYFSPDTSRAMAFFGALAFMVLTVAAGYAARR